MAATVPAEKMLSRTQVAALLNVPPSTLASWAYRGVGPRYFRLGKHARYRLGDVNEWLSQRAAGG